MTKTEREHTVERGKKHTIRSNVCFPLLFASAQLTSVLLNGIRICWLVAPSPYRFSLALLLLK